MDLADKLKMALDEGRLLILGAQVVSGASFKGSFGGLRTPIETTDRAGNWLAGFLNPIAGRFPGT